MPLICNIDVLITAENIIMIPHWEILCLNGHKCFTIHSVSIIIINDIITFGVQQFSDGMMAHNSRILSILLIMKTGKQINRRGTAIQIHFMLSSSYIQGIMYNGLPYPLIQPAKHNRQNNIKWSENILIDETNDADGNGVE